MCSSELAVIHIGWMFSLLSLPEIRCEHMKIAVTHFLGQTWRMIHSQSCYSRSDAAAPGCVSGERLTLPVTLKAAEVISDEWMWSTGAVCLLASGAGCRLFIPTWNVFCCFLFRLSRSLNLTRLRLDRLYFREFFLQVDKLWSWGYRKVH